MGKYIGIVIVLMVSAVALFGTSRNAHADFGISEVCPETPEEAVAILGGSPNSWHTVGNGDVLVYRGPPIYFRVPKGAIVQSTVYSADPDVYPFHGYPAGEWVPGATEMTLDCIPSVLRDLGLWFSSPPSHCPRSRSEAVAQIGGASPYWKLSKWPWPRDLGIYYEGEPLIFIVPKGAVVFEGDSPESRYGVVISHLPGDLVISDQFSLRCYPLAQVGTD